MAVTTTQTNGKVSGPQLPARANGGNGSNGAARNAAAPGSRLAEAFEAVERFPVLIESRERVIAAATAETTRIGDLVEAVESDVALSISVLRFANRSGVSSGGVGGIPEAVEVLKPSGVLAIAGTAPSFDFFESNGGWELKPERFRVHALAAQRAADQIGRVVGWVERDELAVAALLHDVGRLVISRLHPGYKVYFDAGSRTPEQRLRDEREQLGIDHTLVGGVLARRWNLPQRIAIAIERHHAEDSDGLAAMVATADMVAHYSQGEAISPERLRASAERCGLGPDGLRDLLYEMPLARQDSRRVSEPCPLSARELDVLRHLSEGMVYKQIAGEMQLSVSTIRTHLHNVYGKIGAVDRAQAVLTARDCGWI
ncbi:MAG TPA: HDOD domain-containing protein [Solirubrobacterales bacterium]|jgi:putative nucleotidyltransferase with HDIG domain|nr:HDOD domain-containing protein [Solirubrobacterales bacterium]